MADSISIQAAVCRQFGAPLSLETLTLAPPLPQQVRIKLSAAAICHSDITQMNGGWGGELPAVFGHEAAGVITDVGSAVKNFTVGSRVIVSLIRSCGHCPMCEQGAPVLCAAPNDNDNRPRLSDADGKTILAGFKTGGFAEQVVVDASQIITIPDDFPFDCAALLSCGVLTGWGAVSNTANLSAGATAAVVGCGGVGINCLQAAAAAGAFPLVAVDINDNKLKLAKQFGATHTIRSDREDAAAQLAAIAPDGLEFVFVAAGSGRAVEAAAAMLAPLGALVLAGMPADGDLVALDATELVHRQRRILGSKMGGATLRRDIPKLIALHQQGRLRLKELIAARRPLAEINDAIAAAKTGDALRQVLVFDTTQ